MPKGWIKEVNPFGQPIFINIKTREKVCTYVCLCTQRFPPPHPSIILSHSSLTPQPHTTRPHPSLLNLTPLHPPLTLPSISHRSPHPSPFNPTPFHLPLVPPSHPPPTPPSPLTLLSPHPSPSPSPPLTVGSSADQARYSLLQHGRPCSALNGATNY